MGTGTGLPALGGLSGAGAGTGLSALGGLSETWSSRPGIVVPGWPDRKPPDPGQLAELQQQLQQKLPPQRVALAVDGRCIVCVSFAAFQMELSSS